MLAVAAHCFLRTMVDPLMVWSSWGWEVSSAIVCMLSPSHSELAHFGREGMQKCWNFQLLTLHRKILTYSHRGEHWLCINTPINFECPCLRADSSFQCQFLVRKPLELGEPLNANDQNSYLVQVLSAASAVQPCSCWKHFLCIYPRIRLSKKLWSLQLCGRF